MGTFLSDNFVAIHVRYRIWCEISEVWIFLCGADLSCHADAAQHHMPYSICVYALGVITKQSEIV